MCVVDLVGRVKDGVKVVFLSEAGKGEDIICDGILNCVCHCKGVEASD